MISKDTEAVDEEILEMEGIPNQADEQACDISDKYKKEMSILFKYEGNNCLGVIDEVHPGSV